MHWWYFSRQGLRLGFKPEICWWLVGVKWSFSGDREVENHHDFGKPQRSRAPEHPDENWCHKMDWNTKLCLLWAVEKWSLDHEATEWECHPCDDVQCSLCSCLGHGNSNMPAPVSLCNLVLAPSVTLISRANYWEIISDFLNINT